METIELSDSEDIPLVHILQRHHQQQEKPETEETLEWKEPDEEEENPVDEELQVKETKEEIMQRNAAWEKELKGQVGSSLQRNFVYFSFVQAKKRLDALLQQSSLYAQFLDEKIYVPPTSAVDVSDLVVLVCTLFQKTTCPIR